MSQRERDAVRKWIKKLVLEPKLVDRYCQLFEEEEIFTLRHVKKLEERHLQSIGVKVGTLVLMTEAIKELNSTENQDRAIFTHKIQDEDETKTKLNEGDEDLSQAVVRLPEAQVKETCNSEPPPIQHKQKRLREPQMEDDPLEPLNPNKKTRREKDSPPPVLSTANTISEDVTQKPAVKKRFSLSKPQSPGKRTSLRLSQPDETLTPEPATKLLKDSPIVVPDDSEIAAEEEVIRLCDEAESMYRTQVSPEPAEPTDPAEPAEPNKKGSQKPKEQREKPKRSELINEASSQIPQTPESDIDSVDDSW